jgi:lysophospholipase L1-like esterase
MRRIVAAGIGGVLAALALASSASSTLHARPRVTVIGDSIITGVAYTPQARTLLGRNVDLRWQAAVCRRLVQPSCWYKGDRPPTALDVIQGNAGALGDTVVVESGYNEYAQQYPTDLATVMTALKAAGVQTVLWLTLRETRQDYAAMNDQIRAAAGKWPQLVVVDWNAASRNRPWFTDDGLHLDFDGAMGMARLLRPYIVKYACAGICRRFGPPD